MRDAAPSLDAAGRFGEGGACDDGAVSDGQLTKVQQSAGVDLLLFVVFPLIGAALLQGVNLSAGWLLSLPWVPFGGPLRLLDGAPEPGASIGALGAGAVLGLVIGCIGKYESLVVEVSGGAAVLTRKGESRTVQRADAGAVFLDGKELVVLGRDTAELARVESDLGAADLEAAFREHGYPWRDGDPHRAEFRRWVPDLTELADSDHALLKARQRALDKKDAGDAEELRQELAKLGVVVRDDKKTQHWRKIQRGLNR